MDAALDEPSMAVDLNTIKKQTNFDKERHEVHLALALSLSPLSFSSISPSSLCLSLCLSLFSLSHVLFLLTPPFPISTHNTHTHKHA
jgi:hypothetical protein